MGQYSWDRGLDFAETRLKLVQTFQDLRPETTDSINSIIRTAHASTLLIQLINGARVSEAFDAMKGWANNGELNQEVRVRKRRPHCICGHIKANDRGESTGHESTGKSIRGRCRVSGCQCQTYRPNPLDVEMRLAVIPPELTLAERDCCQEAIRRGVNVNSTKLFALRVMGFNSHSLRYTQITELAKGGMAPQLIAKVTHHKTLTFILSYTQQKEADKALGELAARGKA